MVGFCRRLIQTPSLPGREEALADLIRAEMQKLGYDQVWVDEVGNVIGCIRGRRRRPAVMFTAHMDHVDAGDPVLWSHPPYGGVLADGYLHGRGASDTKGAIATQVYLPTLLTQRPLADVYVAQVVLEEKGGVGTQHLVKTLRPDVVILGEATANQLALGHRGRLEVVVTAAGRAAHASVPARGVVPHYPMARFLLRLRELPMQSAGDLSATVAPTLYYTDQKSANVIPGKAVLHLDWRTVPGEEPEDVLLRIDAILDQEMTARLGAELLSTYTGVEVEMAKVRLPYRLDPQSWPVPRVRAAVRRTCRRPVALGSWDFVTDAGYFAEQGIPVIGFSPGEEHYAHTYEDRVALALMEEALACYPEIVRACQADHPPVGEEQPPPG